MNTQISNSQIEFYQKNGFLVVDNLLDDEELDTWRAALATAIEQHIAKNAERGSSTFHNQNRDSYYKDVFVQCVNLWKTNDRMKELVLDRRLGMLASDLAGVGGVRLYHDHALVKQPWANPTNWHVDNPGDPFYTRDAVMLWITLDDATLQNGCLYFMPGTHRSSRFGRRSGSLNEAKIDGLFAAYPEWSGIEPVAAEASAGAGVFINGMIAHAAGPNMTIHPRRVMALLFMPEGSVYNGHSSALPEELTSRLSKGDLLADDEHLPLVFSRSS